MKMKIIIQVNQASILHAHEKRKSLNVAAREKSILMFHRSQRSRVTNKDQYYFLYEIRMVYCIDETTREAIRLGEISLHQI